jgi:lipopolysaccharide/colanic/teichoic acid biosynthesis glycosyltransferase
MRANYFKDGKILHTQARVGKKGPKRIIHISKIRTMKKDSHKNYPRLFTSKNGLSRDNFNKENITKIGRFLRFTKLDESPQIVNLFKRELRLIGIRPLCKEDYYRLPKKSRELYDKYGPGLFTVFASIPPEEITREKLHAEYEKFYNEVAKKPLRTNTKYLSKIFWLFFKKMIKSSSRKKIN